ncbi:MAG: amidase [Acidobacteriota bacterium]|nr:amidase [Acidobacteriota bacterium]
MAPTRRNTRREFLAEAAAGVLLATTGCKHTAPGAGSDSAAGSPPAFASAPAVGPAVSESTFEQAEKLMQVSMTPAQRTMAAESWRVSMAGLMERRTGPRKVEITEADAPAMRWTPVSQDQAPPGDGRFVRSPVPNTPLPQHDDDIAFAPLTQLSRWIEHRQLTSERLTRIYLDRLKQFDSKLHCVITLTEELALQQARTADGELASGIYRGPLHGIPWGAKDLLDTAGIPTTYGAEPFRNRIPITDATVVQRLHEAGAVLVAKLSLGALALNDVWFGGQTRNPWLLAEGSSGSSAGPAAATAAGLVGFAIASETDGSITSPSMRCGVTGLRPTFGRVPRGGAMTLCWSMDKLGPMARRVEDTMLVLRAISGFDAGDLSCVPSQLNFDATAPLGDVRIGYFPQWLHEDGATEIDRAAVDHASKLGMQLVVVSLPDWPYDDLDIILFAEAAASFEQLTLSGGVDTLKMQTPDAWPNTFRLSRFLSAVDLIQADRLRRKVALEMRRVMSEVDVLLVPSLRDEMLTITNFTGHPSLTFRAGFVQVSEPRTDWAPDASHPVEKLPAPQRVPYSVTLIGQLFGEGRMARIGMALETAFQVAEQRPPGF